MSWKANGVIVTGAASGIGFPPRPCRCGRELSSPPISHADWGTTDRPTPLRRSDMKALVERCAGEFGSLNIFL
jgi:hypothetical protein